MYICLKGSEKLIGAIPVYKSLKQNNTLVKDIKNYNTE